MTFYVAAGYISHIAIDLLNKTGVQLFFPIPGRFCLELASSHGICNKILFVLGLLVTVALTFFECLTIIGGIGM